MKNSDSDYKAEDEGTFQTIQGQPTNIKTKNNANPPKPSDSTNKK